MEPEFAPILAELQRLREWPAVRTSKVHGSEAHRFRVNPSLSEDEARAFELRHGIQLPEEYRGFLLQVGNGGAGPGYGLFPLGMEDRGNECLPWIEGDWLVGILSEPFPHTEPWNDLTGMPEWDVASEDDPELEAGHQERRRAWEMSYFDTANVNGAIPICHLGCGIQQWLIVTGPEAGRVWTDRRIDCRGVGTDRPRLSPVVSGVVGRRARAVVRKGSAPAFGWRRWGWL